MVKFTVIDYARSDEHLASVHKVGCGAIERDKIDHYGRLSTTEAESGSAAAEKWSEEINSDFGGDGGFIPEDVKVHDCTKGI